MNATHGYANALRQIEDPKQSFHKTSLSENVLCTCKGNLIVAERPSLTVFHHQEQLPHEPIASDGASGKTFHSRTIPVHISKRRSHETNFRVSVL